MQYIKQTLDSLHIEFTMASIQVENPNQGIVDGRPAGE